MKYTTSALIAQNSALLAQPYGAKRNAKLERVQLALESRGFQIRRGEPVRMTRATLVRGFQVLSAA